MVVLLLIGRLLMMMVNSDWIVKVRIHGEFRDKTGGVFAFFFFFSSLFFFFADAICQCDASSSSCFVTAARYMVI